MHTKEVMHTATDRQVVCAFLMWYLQSTAGRPEHLGAEQESCPTNQTPEAARVTTCALRSCWHNEM